MISSSMVDTCFICPLCLPKTTTSLQYRSFSSLSRHYRRNHKDLTSLSTCAYGDCSTVFSKGTPCQEKLNHLVKHAKDHLWVDAFSTNMLNHGFFCLECSLCYAQRYSMDYHIMVSHKHQITPAITPTSRMATMYSSSQQSLVRNNYKNQMIEIEMEREKAQSMTASTEDEPSSSSSSSKGLDGFIDKFLFQFALFDPLQWTQA